MAGHSLLQMVSPVRPKAAKPHLLEEEQGTVFGGIKHIRLVHLILLGAMGLFVGLVAWSLVLLCRFPAESASTPGDEDKKAHLHPKPKSPITRVVPGEQQPLEWNLSPHAVRAAARAAEAERGKGSPLVASPHVCPGLVVPSDSECRLLLPASAFREPPAEGAVVDIGSPVGGQTLMQCTLTIPDWSAAELCPVAVLHTPERPVSSSEPDAEPCQQPADEERPIPSGESDAEPCSRLAYCKAGSNGDGVRIAYVYDAYDELFAQVVFADEDPPSYVLESGRTRLLFQGDFDGHQVEITGEQGRRLAAVWPPEIPGGDYELRVSAGADVGVVLCGLFAVSQLQSG